MSASRHHLDIEEWLKKLELLQYADLLRRYKGVESILWISERDLKDHGIKNGGHRARLMTSLTVLREKYEKANKGSHGNSNHSPREFLTVNTLNSKSQGSSGKDCEGVSECNNSTPGRSSEGGRGSLSAVSPCTSSGSECNRSPVHRLHLEAQSPAVRSWPSSGQSSHVHTRRSSHRSSLEGCVGADATADDLKKALEIELGLDSSDLRSYAWYHGTILRQRAEELVAEDGNFVVRDCISQPGDFVLTCRWKGLSLHFIIKKVILHQDTVYEKIQYSFDEDCFDSISDFITSYVGSRRPLSLSSGAVISRPINRTMPLSYYVSRYGVQCQIHYVARALEKVPLSPRASLDSPSKSPKLSPESSPDSQKKTLTPQTVVYYDSNKANSITSINSVTDNKTLKETAHPRRLTRIGSDPVLNPNIEVRTLETRPQSGTISTETAKEIASMIENEKPPPKPSRVPSRRHSQKPLVVKRERKITPSTPLSDGDDVKNVVFEEQSSIPLRNRVQFGPSVRKMSGETRFSFLDRCSVSDDGSESEIGDALFTIPSLHPPSYFLPLDFKSTLLENENKPLQRTILSKIRRVLLAESARHLACHLTKIDLEIMKNIKDEDLGLGVTCGLELVLLPQGQQLQKDLLERTECLRLFIAITILTADTEEEQVNILHKWIEIATETKTTLGNFYGFSNIMLGLTLPEVSCLQSLWLALRHSYTQTAFSFETKLRPILKSMQETSGLDAPNTCIPYVLSLVSIMQQHLTIVNTMQEPLDDECMNKNVLSFNLPGDQNSGDFGLQLLENHLEIGRNMMQQCAVFRKNAEITLQSMNYVDVLLEIFCTEFHLRLLWGSRGANASSKERHDKFNQVLQVLSKLCMK